MKWLLDAVKKLGSMSMVSVIPSGDAHIQWRGWVKKMIGEWKCS